MSLSPSTSLRSVPCRFVPRCLLNCLPPLVQHEVQALDASDPIEEIQTMRESLGGTLGYFIFRLGASLDEISDRKSTRLNSSHQIISYAVFCLKKKIKDREQ